MKYYITNILLTIGICSIPNISFSARTTRSLKNAQIKSVSKKSVGLVSSGAKITCSNPGDPNCIGPNQNTNLTAFECPAGQTKGANNYCICENSDYIVDPNDSTKCILQTSSVGTALKKECGNILIRAVKAQCQESYLHNGMGGNNDEEYKCYDPDELYALFNTKNLKVYIDGKQYDYDAVCNTYTENLMKSIATDYETTGENSIACKRARTIANASSECFAMVLSAGKATGATEAIRGNLEKTCGTRGLNQQYQKLFGDIPAGIIFPTNIPSLYVNAGKNSLANGLDMIGKYLDGKITDKTDTWEREITVINNSYLNQVSAMCGQEYAVSMHNEDIQILDEKSSLQRMIDEKGSLAGATEWVSNQASVILGENRINKIKREGVLGGIDDTDVGMNGSKIYKLTRNISSTNGLRDAITEELKEENTTIPYALFTFKAPDEKEYYRIIKLTHNDIGDNKYTYETISFESIKNQKLPNDLLTEMIGKNESDIEITNGTVKK